MTDVIYNKIKQTFLIEKLINGPDVILFQNDDFTEFIEPKYIYAAYSEDMKMRYKAQTKKDLAEFIYRNLNTLKFKRS